jgi:hypothetical protein
MSLTNVKGDAMHIRSNAYLQMIARLRVLRALFSNTEPVAQQTSPLLIFIAVGLALLLAMLEVDRHSAELQAPGLATRPFPTEFVSP